MTYRYGADISSPMIVWNLADHMKFSRLLRNPWIHSSSIKLWQQRPFRRMESIIVSSTRNSLLEAAWKLSKASSGPLFLKTIVITWERECPWFSLHRLHLRAMKINPAVSRATLHLWADRFESLYQTRSLSCHQRQQLPCHWWTADINQTLPAAVTSSGWNRLWLVALGCYSSLWFWCTEDSLCKSFIDWSDCLKFIM